MSSTIYNGFSLLLHDIHDIQAEIMEFRKDCTAVAKNLLTQWLARETAHLIDEVALGRAEKSDLAPLRRAWKEFEQRRREVERTRQRDPEIDFTCNLTLIPCYLDGRHQILGIIFTDQAEMRRRWFKKEYVLEFGYWNDTDCRPSTVTKASWEDRKEWWNAALPDAGVPSENGFSCKIVPDYLGYPKPSTVVRSIARFDTRVSLWSRRLLIDCKVEELAGAEKIDSGNVFRFANTALLWLNTPEGEAAFEAKKAEVAAKLPKKITVDMLLGRETE